MEVLAPVRRLRARRELGAARRLADAELIATTLPSPRLAWRTNELCSDEHRRGLAESLVEVARASEARYLPGSSPLNRVAARDQLATAPSDRRRPRGQRAPRDSPRRAPRRATPDRGEEPALPAAPPATCGRHSRTRSKRSRDSVDDARAGAAAADQAARRRSPEIDRRVRGDAASKAARAPDLRLGRALLGRLRDRGRARRPPRSRRSPAARSSCPCRSRSRHCSRS